MSNTDFEGLYKSKDHIFQSLKNEDEAFIAKISYYKLHVLSIVQFFVMINKLCCFEKQNWI